MLWAVLAAFGADDATILARIAASHAASEQLVVDGDTADWVPFYATAQEAEVRRVAIAPTADRLTVMVELAAGVESIRPLFLGVDTAGRHPTDTSIRINGTTAFVSFSGSKRWRPLAEAMVARKGPFVELTVPWTAIAAQAPKEHEAKEGPRSWVRVRAMLSREDGARPPPLAVASYLLTDPPPPLDDPVPVPEAERIEAGIPVVGTWFIGQGAQHGPTHDGVWAYDLSIRDVGHRGRLGGGLEGSLAWGQSLYSPNRGRVRTVESAQPDLELEKGTGEGKEANRVVIDLDDRTRIKLAHLMQGSAKVSPDERVSAGQVVGRVGNSGASSGPHVHIVHIASTGLPGPVRWPGVTVGLNPTPDDPWARTPVAWEPRPGWFVTAPPFPRTPDRVGP